MLAGAAGGFIDSFLLSGFGICGGFPLSWGVFGFGAFTALFPAGTVGVFRGPWWLPAVVYFGPLFIAVLGGALGRVVSEYCLDCLHRAGIRWRMVVQAAFKNEKMTDKRGQSGRE